MTTYIGTCNVCGWKIETDDKWLCFAAYRWHRLKFAAHALKHLRELRSRRGITKVLRHAAASALLLLLLLPLRGMALFLKLALLPFAWLYGKL